jgi:hypothetical protein
MITKWHFLMLLIMGIDALDQIIHITELASLVGVKVPNESIEISDWTTDYMGLIVEVQSNNEMYVECERGLGIGRNKAKGDSFKINLPKQQCQDSLIDHSFYTPLPISVMSKNLWSL